MDGRDGRDGKDGIASRDELNEAVKAAVAEAVEPEVERRVKAVLETIPLVTYQGTWKSAETYEPGDMATWGGCVWHCDKTTTTKPGTDPEAWTLAVKAGRDGRDAR